MSAIVVVGAQWGDEGKGKVVDYLAASFDYIARCAGGHNAGHTVIFNGSRFVLQLIPCGILRPGKHAVIGSGVVVDPAALVAELDTLAKAGIDVTRRLHLSKRAHLIFPYHRQMEKAAEAARGADKIGTTSRGIGPAYEDKMARHGIRVGDMFNAARFREKLQRVICEKDAVCRATYGVPLDSVFAISPIPIPEIVSGMFPKDRAEGERTIVTGSNIPTAELASRYSLAPITITQIVHVIYLMSPTN